MGTLVIVEHNNHDIQTVTQHVISAAKKLGNQITLLVVGFDCQSVAHQASLLEHVDAVWVADNPCYEHKMAENVATLVVELASAFKAILVSSSTYGKNLLPRVAALLDVAQVSDVTKIIDSKTFEHPIYAGNALEKIRVLDEKTVLTIRSTAFDAVGAASSPCQIEPIENKIQLQHSTYISSQLSQSQRPELTQAKKIVSGGRGLKNQENFQLIEQLADALGAAVGASRAAVDAGFVSNDYQVGQTGKVVAPLLYIAIGISGAVQHLAGMKDSKVIVAINKDEEAPIMQIANYYLVGDLFDLVPKLISQLSSRQ